jgi:hypothetical protein
VYDRIIDFKRKFFINNRDIKHFLLTELFTSKRCDEKSIDARSSRIMGLIVIKHASVNLVKKRKKNKQINDVT